MAQVPGMFDLSALLGFGAGSPDVNPGLANLPQKEGEAPMPYSPEGWQASKLVSPVQGEEQVPKAPEKGEAKKKASTGFTPEQAMALQRMVTVEQPKAMPAHAGGGAGGSRGQIGQMQQVQAGGVTTAPRSSLGQILYGGRKF